MNRKLAPFIENMSEATAACLVAMVQGNLLAITLGHWLVASQTGILAGMIAGSVLLVWKTGKTWIVAATLGIATAAVDFFVHPGGFGPIFFEAAVTGLAAAILSLLIGTLLKRIRQRRQSATSIAGDSHH
jgi:hypothetical protein